MVLRAKIDMANPNMHFRDPIIYRIIKTPHHRTGTKWNCYPMYDFAHGQSDYFEGVTHSICTLEFVPHRPLYDLFIDYLKEKDGTADNLADNRPRQIEFNRLNLTYTVMSKRKLHTLVDEHMVSGWDDPRMPTLCGMRRRGYSPESIRKFIDSIGYTKFDALNDVAPPGGCRPRRPQQEGLPRECCPRPREARHHQLSRRRDRGDGGHQQSRERGRRHPYHHLLQGVVDRACRLHGGRPKEVLPPGCQAARCASRTPIS